MDLGLAERTALVCASTSGLGLATARALCEDGARVVVTSRSSERAEEVAAALPNAIGIGCDLLAADGAARLFGESTKRVGKIDILVLNGPGPAPGTSQPIPIAYAAATSSARSLERLVTTTLAPSSNSARAVARPNPCTDAARHRRGQALRTVPTRSFAEQCVESHTRPPALSYPTPHYDTKPESTDGLGLGGCRNDESAL